MTPADPTADVYAAYADGDHTLSVAVAGLPGLRRFSFASNASQVDGLHTHGGARCVDERSTGPYADTGSPVLDGLFALALAEVGENAVESICDAAFSGGHPIPLAAFETGAKWHYVWTRDLAYAVDLGLAGLDVRRCVASLKFKTSGPKPGVAGGGDQVLQDTGSGGSYPVSTDRAVWAIAAAAVAPHLDAADRAEFVAFAYPLLRDTAEQDRQLVFDPADGLYRGEQSFLDWREQTYPLWTAADVLAIALSKATSTNVTHVALLATAAAFAAELGDAAGAARYGGWATELRAAINAHLWDEQAGLYSAYLLTASRWSVRAKRYDLLGQALAIEWGVASAERADRMLTAYPCGPHGPPVAWPQEQAVPIYHNHAIWPFVTAYWTRAAAGRGHGHAVSLGLHSLVRGAAINLSNMENMDLVTGTVHATVHGISGPVISSQRQLWSVAGFVGVVRDVIFGLTVGADGGISIRPCLTPAVRRRYLGPGDTVALRNVTHLGRRLDVVLHLPVDGDAAADRPYAVTRVRHNGEPDDGAVMVPARLSAVNRWELWLDAAAASSAAAARVPVVTDFADVRSYFGPREPTWGEATVEAGRRVLRFASAGPGAVAFDVYRDGQPVAAGVDGGTWADPDLAAGSAVHDYAVEAFFPDTGHRSHPSPELTLGPADATVEVAVAAELDAELRVPLGPTPGGPHVVRLRYANPAPVSTGITCCVKRWDVVPAGGGPAVAGGYVVLPHTAGATRLSSPMAASLAAGAAYTLRLRDDPVARNMSYLEHNRMYTAHAGGGPVPYNRATIAAAVVTRRT